MCVDACASWHAKATQDIFRSQFSFYYVSVGIQTKAIRLGSQHSPPPTPPPATPQAPKVREDKAGSEVREEVVRDSG